MIFPLSPGSMHCGDFNARCSDFSVLFPVRSQAPEEELVFLLPGFSAQSGLRVGEVFDPTPPPAPPPPPPAAENATEEEVAAREQEITRIAIEYQQTLDEHAKVGRELGSFETFYTISSLSGSPCDLLPAGVRQRLRVHHLPALQAALPEAGVRAILKLQHQQDSDYYW